MNSDGISDQSQNSQMSEEENVNQYQATAMRMQNIVAVSPPITLAQDNRHI